MPQSFLRLVETRLSGKHCPLASEVLALALPVIGQMLFRTVLFFVDRSLLGHYSADALASMQISGTYLFALLMIVGAFTVGAIAVVGRAIGEGNGVFAGASVRGTVLLSALLGSLATLFTFLFLPQLLSSFSSATEAVRLAASNYLIWIAPALGIYLLVMAQTAILQATGDTKTPFRIACFSTLVHIALDVVLIFGYLGFSPLGTTGAALASLIATSLQCLLLVFAVSKNPKLRLYLWGFGQEREAIRHIMHVSMPAFIERAVQYGGFFIYALLIGAIGSFAMATHQALVAIGAICFLSADGFGVAAATSVARTLGSHDIKRAERIAKIATSYSFIFLSLVAIVFYTIPHLIMRLFTEDPEIIALGASCLKISALAQPLSAIAVVLADSLRGAGDTKTAAIISIFGGVVVRFLVGYVLAFSFGMGLVGIWWGIVADWLSRCLIVVPVIFRGRWTYKEV